MTTTAPLQPIETGGAGPPGRGRKPWLVVAVAVLVALVAAGSLALVVLRSGDDQGAPATTTVPTATTATTPTTVPTTAPTTVPPTTPPTTPPAGDASTAVWPHARSSTRYADPLAAARGFAVDYLGVVNPAVGPFMAGDARSGEVTVGAMTVFVRQLGTDGTWWVLGSSADRILLDTPTSLDVISSPVRLQGRSSAFEANVSVEIREDGNRFPLGTGFVMGGAFADLEPFDGVVTFSEPTAVNAGAIVLFERSARDGRIDSASVVRVFFTSSVPVEPPLPCPTTTRPTAPSGQMVVTVYFTCNAEALVPAYRLAPASTGVLRAALERLLAGPTPAERAAGLGSWFSEDTGGMLAGVSLSDGKAVVDFRDLRPVIPNASTSAGSQLLLRQLDATVFQFPTVRSVEYRINGSCSTFFEWLQMACTVRSR